MHLLRHSHLRVRFYGAHITHLPTPPGTLAASLLLGVFPGDEHNYMLLR
jgi:hypothetical protein